MALLASLAVHLPVYEALGVLAGVVLHGKSGEPESSVVELEMAPLPGEPLPEEEAVAEKEPEPKEPEEPEPEAKKKDTPKPEDKPKPEKEKEAEAIFRKWGLDFAVVGETTPSKRFIVRHGGDVMAQTRTSPGRKASASSRAERTRTGAVTVPRLAGIPLSTRPSDAIGIGCTSGPAGSAPMSRGGRLVFQNSHCARRSSTRS